MGISIRSLEGGASLLGSGLLVLALCADKERLEAQQNSALWVPDFGRPGPGSWASLAA